MGINDPEKTFHSFRHTMIDELRDAGHEDSAVTFGVYGSRTPIKAMAEALGHLSLLGDISSTLTLKDS